MRLLPGVLLLCAYTAVITVALLPLHYAQHHPLPHSLTHKGTGEEESFLLPLPLQHWVPLSEDSLLAWYPRSIEQCMLRNHTTETDVKALYVRCKGKGRRMGDICMPGMGNGGSCPGHPSKRPYFFKALSSFNDPRARPLTSLFQNLKLEQKASRENLEVVPDHADRNCFWRFNISIHQTLPDSEKSWVPVHFMRIGSLDTQSMCPSNKVGKYHLGNRSYTLGNWKSVKEITRHLIENEVGGALLVMNIGIWYHRYQQKKYSRDLQEEFLPFMIEAGTYQNKQSNVVFLESIVQHWNSPVGDYTQRAARMSHGSPFCFPLATNYSVSLEGDWRNYIVRQELSAILKPGNNITLLPIAEALVAAETAHMSSSDCTHMCYFPTLFQFLWHALQLVASKNCMGKYCL